MLDGKFKSVFLQLTAPGLAGESGQAAPPAVVWVQGRLNPSNLELS